MDLSTVDISKLIGNYDLPEEIERDARNISASMEPRYEFPKQIICDKIPLGRLPEDLEILRRLVLWYSYKLSLEIEDEEKNILAKKMFIEGLYDYLFHQKYRPSIPKGYRADVFKSWTVIAYPRDINTLPRVNTP